MRVYTIKMHILGSSNELSIYQEGSNELISNLKSNQQTALAKGKMRTADLQIVLRVKIQMLMWTKA